MKTPNFTEILRTINYLYSKGLHRDAEDELVQLYKYGFHDGLNNGWAVEQDKQYAENNKKEG